MILQDWQKQILKMTEGQILPPVFTTKKQTTWKTKKNKKGTTD